MLEVPEVVSVCQKTDLIVIPSSQGARLESRGLSTGQVGVYGMNSFSIFCGCCCGLFASVNSLENV